MASTDTCPRCHGDGILRRKGDGILQRKADGIRPRRSSAAIDCPQCGGLGRLVSVSDASNTGQLSESLQAMMWPFTIRLSGAQRELFAATVLALSAVDQPNERLSPDSQIKALCGENDPALLPQN
jgi:hypothetical protein